MPDFGASRQDLVFRVFVSSTFSDLIAERDALEARAFHSLRKYCLEMGARFQAIDLRWGISEEAALDQQTMNICLHELRRCKTLSPRPNFIVLVGGRYGWRPLPPQISAIELEALAERAQEIQPVSGDPPSVPAHDFVYKWYARDDNAKPPEYCLQPLSPEPRGDQSSDHPPLSDDEWRHWKQIEFRLRTLLLRAARAHFPEGDPRLDKYEDSATHQEIRQGALESADAPGHVFAYFRTTSDVPKDATAEHFLDITNGSLDVEAAQRLAQLQTTLKARLPSAHIYECTARWQRDGEDRRGAPITHDHLDGLCARVESDLRSIIKAECDAFGRRSDLEREIEAHEQFARGCAAHFVGRASQLDRIGKYLLDGNRHPLVVHGASGSGKTAVVAKALEEASRPTPKADLVVRFAGVTPASSDTQAMLQSICQQLAALCGDGAPAPVGYRELVHDFSRRLGLAARNRRVVLLLDALDQLAANYASQDLNWLPADLPANVKLIVSTLESAGAEGTCFRTLSRLVPSENRLRVDALLPQEGEELLDAWLNEANRTLQPEQRREVLGKFQACRFPLYLKLAFEAARRWKSYDVPPALGPDIPGIVNRTLNGLAEERRHGPVLTNRALGYLAASRRGLTEDELVEALSSDPQVLAAFRRRSPRSPVVAKLPVVIWSRLRADLEPYLSECRADGTIILRFYHRAIRDAAMQRLSGEEVADLRTRLVTQFSLQPSMVHDRTAGKIPNHRKCSELPWLLSTMGRWDLLFDLLSDVEFFAPCYSAQKFDVLGYWAGLESAGFGCADAYRAILDSPGQYETELLWDLATLFEARRDLDSTRLLWRSVVDRYKRGESGGGWLETPTLPFALCGLAGAEAALGNREVANGLYEQAERRARADDNALGRAVALDGQGSLLGSSGHLDTALSFYRQEESVCRGGGFSEQLLQCLRNQAAVLTHLGYLHEAYRVLKEQANLAGTMNAPDDKGHALLCIADLLIKANQPTQALDPAVQVLELGQRYGLQSLLAQCQQVVEMLCMHPQRGGPALDLAATNEIDWSDCNEKQIRDLLSAVNQPNLRDRQGRTPLMAAACHGYYKLMTDLLKQGAQVNARDSDGATALQFAQRYHPGQSGFAGLLRSAGADDEPPPSPNQESPTRSE